MANEVVLVEYDKACRQLARAVYANEVMKIREASAIMQACAKVTKNKQLEADAWKLRVQAERRLGEMLRDGKADRAPQGGDRQKDQTKPFARPTLEEIGVSKGLAHRARSLAALSEKDFGLFLIDGAKQSERHVEVVAKKMAAPKPKPKPKPAAREFECPHCSKLVYLTAGQLTK